jgi:hydroxypyruvate reductase
MPRSPAQLRADALAIWHAGLEAVRSDRLVREQVRVEGEWLLIGEETWKLADINRIAVVGAGKAGAGMAAGLETALGPRVLAEKKVVGWINVPADCVRKLSHIHLHAARPAGVNEPTEEGVFGTQRILEIVASLGPTDLCLCLISGGGSALLPAPVPGVSLADKQAIARLLSSAGANIKELNTVRKQLSRIKGGGLARACPAEHLVSLIISDVLGDPLDVIASGPTVLNTASAARALEVVERLIPDKTAIPASINNYLASKAAQKRRGRSAIKGIGIRSTVMTSVQHFPTTLNLVIGNNALAVDAAGIEAERRGYSHAMHAANSLEGPAEAVGIHHAQMALRMLREPGPDCLITGGEPTVKLAPPEIRGKGGRNQQLVLAALTELISDFGFRIADSRTGNPSPNPQSAIPNPPSLALLSAGTDGEDGPTDAAGAILDGEIFMRAGERGLDPRDFLRRNDAYHFFEPLGGLIKTGPTDTNVCDVRVVVVDRE